MLDQLVESTDAGSGGTRRGGLLIVTGILIFSGVLIGLVGSLFAQNLTVGGDGLELSSLIAPVPLPEEAPPPPDEPEPEKKQTQQNNDQKVDTRTKIIANINESPTKPPKIKTTKSNVPQRRLGATTQVGATNSNAASTGGPTRSTSGSGGGGGISSKPTTVEPKKPEAPKAKAPAPPPAKPKPKVPKRISGGVVNGKAISLPKPPYPAAARAVRAKGQVRVSVVISKTGKVISASASSGHPLLKRAALAAARRAKFRPTKLSGQPVEVTGVIVYNFKP